MIKIFNWANAAQPPDKHEFHRLYFLEAGSHDQNNVKRLAGMSFLPRTPGGVHRFLLDKPSLVLFFSLRRGK
jgi:hypothetical protein